ncbi:MAG TPA: hypothetical protein DCG34_06450 [Clostridiales bacterium]|nr:hypothetical protein [Clostridiales bacterium]
MAPKKGPRKMAISIDLRHDFSVYGELVWSINSGKFVEKNEKFKVTNAPSFSLKSNNTQSTSKKFPKNSDVLLSFHYIETIKDISQIGYLYKSKGIFEIDILLTNISFSHLYTSLIHTKSEQIFISGSEIYRGKSDITGFYLYMNYDEEFMT